MRIVEPFALLSDIGPAILDARQTSLVKRNRALGQLARSKNPRMINSDTCECRDGSGYPPRGAQVIPKRHPRHDRQAHGKSETEISQPDMDRFEVRNAQLPRLLALDVFFRGRNFAENIAEL